VGFAVLAGRTPEKLTEPSRLRLAVSVRSPLAAAPADKPNREAVATASRLLVVCGHDAVKADPAYPVSLGMRGMATWFAGVYQDASALGIDVATLQPRTRRHIALGGWAMRRGYVREADRAEFRRRCEAFFADGSFDVLVMPALARAPLPAVPWSARSWRANVTSNARYAPFAAPWNIAGFPALVVPVGVRPDGLPLAVQLVGPPGAELVLLAVAGQLEMANPWRRHAPGWPRTESVGTIES